VLDDEEEFSVDSEYGTWTGLHCGLHSFEKLRKVKTKNCALSIDTIWEKAKEKLRVKCCLEDRLLYFFFELCLDILHEDEVSECLFFVCESSVCMVGDIIESRVTHEDIACYHHDHAADERYDEHHPVSLELI
jgi:hypothetical protein